MSFTVETWRERAVEKLAQASSWLGRRQKQDLPYNVYGTIAGLSLWPLVQPAAETGQVADSILALYSITVGVGANIRVMIERILRRHGYPPDKQEKATRTMLEQAEVLANEWALA